MLFEVYASADHTTTNFVPVTSATMDQPGRSFDPSQWPAAWKESHAPFLKFRIPSPALVDNPDIFYFENPPRARLAATLHASFEADPLEDGMYHPAEVIIGEALRSREAPRFLEWLSAFCLDAAHPSFAASVLRCLGRQTYPGTGSWRAGLVRDGLSIDDVEIRDAAVQAVESWGDSDLIDVLEAHSESASWLQDYIRDVIADLRE